MHEQAPLAVLALLLILGALALGYDLGSRGQARKTRQALGKFDKLLADVKMWKSSPEGTAYSRGYSEGYTDCLTSIQRFLERHEDGPSHSTTDT